MREPLLLISQIQRSGGSLTSQLLDDHRQVHCHPKQLHVGRKKAVWPEIDLDAGPQQWLDVMREARTREMFEEGFSKGAWGDPRPCALVPSLLDSLFLGLAEEWRPKSDREVFDLYWTAYFNAWLDNRNLYLPGKRWVAGFAPRLAWGDGLDRFFEVYPDGRLICLLRDPGAWYYSARALSAKLPELEEAIGLWRRGTREILRALSEHSGRVHALRYEELVAAPEAVMRGLAAWLEIEFDPVLLEPTFNGMATWANSSFEVPAAGLLDDRASAWKAELPPEEQVAIERLAGDEYREALEVLSRG